MLLHGLSILATDFPRIQAIQGLFEEQVTRTPQTTVLASDDQKPSYAEMNERANRLAYHLIEQGVQPPFS
ncbi:MAG: amino acid adenylation [Benniella sp.]|nr:MAG: amino acid adenylation [Benniella sp.]